MTNRPFEDMFKQFTAQASKQYTDFYEEFMGKYLRMPPLGIGRETMGESMAAGEAYHKLAMAVGEFIQHFSGPLTDTLASFQEVMDQESDQIDSADKLYKIFMKKLDQKYEAYLRSNAGVQEVSELIDQYLEFKQRVDNAMVPWMDFYNIPNKKDMQEVYRKLHQMRRKNRELEKIVQEQHTALQSLTERITALESPASKTKTVRKKAATTARAKTSKRKPVARKKTTSKRKTTTLRAKQ